MVEERYKMNFYCRKLNVGDIKDVCRLYIVEDNMAYTDEEFVEYVRSAEKVYRQMLERGSYTLGCYTEDKLIGVINVNNILDYYPRYDKAPYVHLETFIVDPEYQNIGVGTLLINTAIDIVKKEGVTYIIIQSKNP